ncbi:alpha/beta hydrolase family protein [Trinickia dinghuensis]|uniref:Alpha/beta fold hydrolase n=1 Tax=Trinickia dinghuensis TaxID=2291023 RepID=A0A3D8JZF2_9BURK|nr:alpha/beta fold hydrolase [Trinickia dinghuensis]RDU97995.1 alpha/beta fold hydrolase [Trinickia dinghuensis]
MTTALRLLGLCLLLLISDARAAQLRADLHESVSTIDVTVKDFYGKQETGKVAITQFSPNGEGPFPILILNHGRATSDRGTPPRFRYTRQVAYFLKRGFIVFVPTRIGYGQYGTAFDPEYSGKCRRKDYVPMIQAARIEESAVLDYAKRQPHVDPHRIVIVGQSVGGFVTTSVAAENPDGVVAAINFAGGSGGDPATHPGVPCESDRLEAMYQRFGKTARVPMLWIYTQNDQFFAPQYSSAWHAAFVHAGGNAEYKLFPPFGTNGHFLFGNGTDIWEPTVSAFLDREGFSR